jgi:hypothetical protein
MSGRAAARSVESLDERSANMRVKLAILVAAACAAGVAALVASAGQPPLEQARNVSAPYHDIANLPADYGVLKDTHGIACIDMPPMPGMPGGAMGIHYVNGKYVGDPTEDPSKPEAVIYEPEKNGKLRLVALEYVVFQAAWDAHHSSRPSLFGQEFNFTPAGNRFGLDPFYSLHVWIWKHNPAGMFEMWNPDVTCANA